MQSHRALAGSRRSFLQASAAAALCASVCEVAWIGPALAQSTLSPDAALQRLLDGNKRYVEQHGEAYRDDLTGLRHKTEARQEPFAGILACADSRVPVEILFDQSIGQLFVARVAGNIASPEIIASLEYGAAVLGTPVIMVLGHSHCGAVHAAMDGEAVPGQISVLFAALRPAIDQSGHDLEAAVKANARIQGGILRGASPVLAGLVKTGELKIVAASYDLASGKVELLT